jgi:hypothetical protein
MKNRTMKLEHEFYTLPLRFDVEKLKKELAAFAESDWQKHPNDYKGNIAIPLISVNGGINDDFAGPMLATPFLDSSPYMRQVIASFDSVVSRSRLMRLEGRHEVPLHSDINYHWWSRVRIHVPIVTTPDVIFHCGDQQVHMAPGEAWIFDSWKMHRVVNPSGKTRVHLVIDTAGSPEFWDLVSRAKTVSSLPGNEIETEPVYIPFQRAKEVNLKMERYNVPIVMSPGEIDAMLDVLIQDVLSSTENDAADLEKFTAIANGFRSSWRSVWALHGPERSGWSDYQRVVERTQKQLFSLNSPLLSNRSVAAQVLYSRILVVAVNPELASIYQPQQPAPEVQGDIVDASGPSGSVSYLQEKIARNAPCPCGSGKKYKRCHGQ